MSDRFDDLMKNFEENNDNQQFVPYNAPTDDSNYADMNGEKSDETQVPQEYAEKESYNNNPTSVYVDYKKPATDYQSFDSNGAEVADRNSYSQPQYVEPQYVEPQYSHNQYTQPQYTQPQYAQP